MNISQDNSHLAGLADSHVWRIYVVCGAIAAFVLAFVVIDIGVPYGESDAKGVRVAERRAATRAFNDWRICTSAGSKKQCGNEPMPDR